ncbi:MAG: 3-deoxy-manno-octulosonate cytidylyltransferase [Firmicutes bacterium]|nr:3-deoxy-manno-octulosonate cytidylyltransferase [Bacillota bacterium]MCM1401276.1 3-deoxy-manno-octulosonate cytidylyltransferase [Bacteroides sp.]MCM1476769.1 3-deoxy-manno-octulosonate cytidylyltransferase [Bacteroides sp.]
MSRTIAIIPARYASTRFPGKPLAEIGGEPMVWHVYRQAEKALGSGNVYVATDNNEIYQAVTQRGGQCVITDAEVNCGTARCAKALDMIGRDAKMVINVQGDEPLIDPADILKVKECFDSPDVRIATLARKFNPADGFEALFNPSNPKVVMDCNNNALLFSRSIIPYVRSVPWQQWLDKATFHIHVGTYGFLSDTLREVAALPPSDLEQTESLEQLRWLQAGYKIKVAITENKPISVDTPADLDEARKMFENK